METALKITQFDELNVFAQLLKDNGYTVIYNVKDRQDAQLPTWLHFFKDGGMGYVQYNKYRGASFTMCYQPSINNGTGCGIGDDNEVFELTLENARRAASRNLPGWMHSNGWWRIYGKP